MSLPRVIIKDHYQDYLNGEEVAAELVDKAAAPLQPGEHVMAFKDSLAAATDIPVPKKQQHHYIGVEGTVLRSTTEGPPHVLVKRSDVTHI